MVIVVRRPGVHKVWHVNDNFAESLRRRWEFCICVHIIPSKPFQKAVVTSQISLAIIENSNIRSCCRNIRSDFLLKTRSVEFQRNIQMQMKFHFSCIIKYVLDKIRYWNDHERKWSISNQLKLKKHKAYVIILKVIIIIQRRLFFSRKLMKR